MSSVADCKIEIFEGKSTRELLLQKSILRVYIYIYI